MGKRRAAREDALQVLFELEFNDVGAEEVLTRHWAEKKTEKAVEEYAGWLVRGIIARRQEIDEIVQNSAEHWRISRMALVDRNILRIAAFELLEEKFLTPGIVINEAIEIAKRYSGDEAAVFVNGVLDAVWKEIEKKNPSLKVKDDESTKEPAKKRAILSAGRRKKE
jgi:N utilization substance protein B